MADLVATERDVSTTQAVDVERTSHWRDDRSRRGTRFRMAFVGGEWEVLYGHRNDVRRGSSGRWAVRTRPPPWAAASRPPLRGVRARRQRAGVWRRHRDISGLQGELRGDSREGRDVAGVDHRPRRPHSKVAAQVILVDTESGGGVRGGLSVHRHRLLFFRRVMVAHRCALLCGAGRPERRLRRHATDESTVAAVYRCVSVGRQPAARRSVGSVRATVAETSGATDGAPRQGDVAEAATATTEAGPGHGRRRPFGGWHRVAHNPMAFTTVVLAVYRSTAFPAHRRGAGACLPPAYRGAGGRNRHRADCRIGGRVRRPVTWPSTAGQRHAGVVGAVHLVAAGQRRIVLLAVVGVDRGRHPVRHHARAPAFCGGAALLGEQFEHARPESAAVLGCRLPRILHCFSAERGGGVRGHARAGGRLFRLPVRTPDITAAGATRGAGAGSNRYVGVVGT
eukprot:ctg_917.g324